MSEPKKTITTIFMVPTLKINRDKLRENKFINAYVKDGRKDVQYEDCIYLLFKPENLDKFKDFLDGEYERTKCVIDDYDYEDGYVVVVYALDEELEEDFTLIREGKYSRTSEKFQKLFPKTVKVFSGGYWKEEISLQYRVFNHTEDLVQFWEKKLDVEFDDDQEVWHAFIEEDETLNLDKIKQNV
jgi:hypothetical protein